MVHIVLCVFLASSAVWYVSGQLKHRLLPCAPKEGQCGALHVSWQCFLSSVWRCAVMCSLWDDVLLCEDLMCFFTRSVFSCVALGCGKGCSWPLTSLDAASIHSQLQMQILRKGTLSLWSRPTLPSRYFLFWFWWLKKSGTPFFLEFRVLELLVGEFASSSTPQASD